MALNLLFAWFEVNCGWVCNVVVAFPLSPPHNSTVVDTINPSSLGADLLYVTNCKPSRIKDFRLFRVCQTAKMHPLELVKNIKFVFARKNLHPLCGKRGCKTAFFDKGGAFEETLKCAPISIYLNSTKKRLTIHWQAVS